MAQSKFDFSKYNELMKSANSGLRLFLALQNLEEVERVMRRFRSPLAKELVDIVDELVDLRKRNQEIIAKRENSGNTESIDNLEAQQQPTTSADGGKIAA